MNPSEGKSVVVNGIRTRYFDAGNGTPLILFHGGGFCSSAEDWEGNYEHLAKYFHVYAFDQLSMGYTDKPKDDFSVTARTSHANELLETLGIKGAHLIGHSQGGYLATSIALEYPDKARSLIVEDSGTTAPMGNFGADGQILSGVRHSHSPEASAQYIMSMYANVMINQSMLTEEFVQRKLIVGRVPGNVDSAIRRGKLSENIEERKRLDLSDKLQLLKVPTLIIWGRQDPFAPLFRGLKLFELIPGASLHVFNHSGHMPRLECMQEWNDVVTAFCLAH